MLESGTCRYIDEGSSDTVLVLIHGLGLEQSVTPVIDNLTEDVRVIVPSLPFITNPKFTKDHTARDYVQYLQDLLKALELDEFCVFGNSIGGTLAFLWAQNYPTAVDKVIARAPLFTRKQLPLIARYEFLLDFYSRLSQNRLMLDTLFSVLMWQFKSAIHQDSHADMDNRDASKKIEGFKKQAESYTFQKSLRDFLLDTTQNQLE